MKNKHSSRVLLNKKFSIEGGKSYYKRFAKKLCLILFFLTALIFFAGISLFFYYIKDAPKLKLSDLNTSISSKIYTRNGELVQDIGSENREKISSNDIPQLLIDALVSVEDHRFYNHVGIDPIRILKSIMSNIIHTGKQGGSTLTQQLIKLSYFSTSIKDQNLRRKAQEAWLALQLEKKKIKARNFNTLC